MTLLQLIESNTNSSCGISPVVLAKKAGIPLTELKPQLNELHTPGQIYVREGINHQLIFKKEGLDSARPDNRKPKTDN